MDGKEKTAAADKGKTTAGANTGNPGGKAGSAVNFNPMDAVRNTVTQVLKDSKCFLLLSYFKTHNVEYCATLQRQIMKSSS